MRQPAGRIRYPRLQPVTQLPSSATCGHRRATRPPSSPFWWRLPPGDPRCFTSAQTPPVRVSFAVSVAASSFCLIVIPRLVASGVASANRRKRPGRQIERYWLCDGCSSLLTLTFDRGRGMITVPLPARNTPAHPLHLRQIQPAKTLSGGAERWVMNLLRNPLCAISGRESSANQLRFLIAENSREDKLTILRWNESIASRPGIKAACSIEHVEELVIHWMTTGRLDYPFARTSHGVGGPRHASPLSRTDLSGLGLSQNSRCTVKVWNGC
jgi:hypothetical protein